MSADFYLHDRALAGYIEKDWYDHILKSDPRRPAFEFAPFQQDQLYSDYHERLIQFLLAATHKTEFKPRQLLEVGSSLGRTFYEVCSQIKSLKSATLIEPSELLYAEFGKIFEGGDSARVSVLKGNLHLQEVQLATAPIKAACAGVDVVRINKPFQKIDIDLGKFDLVICSNVIDQCTDHLELVDFLKRSASPSGIVLLSCTYQWSDKYIGNASDPVKDINDLFDSRWTFLGETNLQFRLRVYERYWMSFLSHVVAYQKPKT
jgi:SAM-dependent methyltransferase